MNMKRITRFSIIGGLGGAFADSVVPLLGTIAGEIWGVAGDAAGYQLYHL